MIAGENTLDESLQSRVTPIGVGQKRVWCRVSGEDGHERSMTRQRKSLRQAIRRGEASSWQPFIEGPTPPTGTRKEARADSSLP